MTTPELYFRKSNQVGRYGVVLALFPSDSEFGMELRRAPDNGSGAPDEPSAETIAYIEPNRRIYVDELAPAAEPVFYQARHIRENYTPSDWTPWTGARPRAIPSQLPLVPPVPDISLSLTVDQDSGFVSLYVNGEPIVRSIKWAWAVDTGFPPLAGGTCEATDAEGDFSAVDFTQLAIGETVYITVGFYDQPACGGNLLGTLFDQEPFLGRLGVRLSEHWWEGIKQAAAGVEGRAVPAFGTTGGTHWLNITVEPDAAVQSVRAYIEGALFLPKTEDRTLELADFGQPFGMGDWRALPLDGWQPVLELTGYSGPGRTGRQGKTHAFPLFHPTDNPPRIFATDQEDNVFHGHAIRARRGLTVGEGATPIGPGGAVLIMPSPGIDKGSVGGGTFQPDMQDGLGSADQEFTATANTVILAPLNFDSGETLMLTVDAAGFTVTFDPASYKVTGPELVGVHDVFVKYRVSTGIYHAHVSAALI